MDADKKGNGKRPQVLIFSDGGCRPNPGPGGWGAILKFPEKFKIKELSGYEPNTTNNKMELTAVIRALEALKTSCEVSVTTDSQYLANAFRQKWLEKWKRNGWKTASKDPVKNKELWQILDSLAGKHQITWKWIKGHAGHPENERCDELATEAREDGEMGI